MKKSNSGVPSEFIFFMVAIPINSFDSLLSMLYL